MIGSHAEGTDRKRIIHWKIEMTSGCSVKAPRPTSSSQTNCMRIAPSGTLLSTEAGVEVHSISSSSPSIHVKSCHVSISSAQFSIKLSLLTFSDLHSMSTPTVQSAIMIANHLSKLTMSDDDDHVLI